MVEMYNRRNWKEVLDIVLPPRKRADFQQKARAAAGAGFGAAAGAGSGAAADGSEAMHSSGVGVQSAEDTLSQGGIEAAIGREDEGDDEDKEPGSGRDTPLHGSLDLKEGDDPIGPSALRLEDVSGSVDGKSVEERGNLSALGQGSGPDESESVASDRICTRNAGKRKEPG